MKRVTQGLAVLAIVLAARSHAEPTPVSSASSREIAQLAASTAPQGLTASAATTPARRHPKILLVQRANLSYLGRREPELYGTMSAADLDDMLRAHAKSHGYDLEIFYTRGEGKAIGRIYRAADEGFDGVVMNPGGFTYAGCALRDCLRTVLFPYVEVHMTNLDKRGIESATAEVAVGVVSGFGTESYVLGLEAMLNRLNQPDAKLTRRP